MKQKEFTTIILEAEEGKYLTQVANVPISERSVVTKVAIGKNDSPDNWREIGIIEAEEYKVLIENAQKELNLV